MYHTRSLVAWTLAVLVACAACDSYYALRRTVSLEGALDAACVENALRAADVGTVARGCDDESMSRYTECFRFQGRAAEDRIVLTIAGADAMSAEAQLSWAVINRRPTVEETTRTRRIMDEAYAAIRSKCSGLPEASKVREVCGWCE